MGTTHLGFAMPYALQQLKKLLISKGFIVQTIPTADPVIVAYRKGNWFRRAKKLVFELKSIDSTLTKVDITAIENSIENVNHKEDTFEKNFAKALYNNFRKVIHAPYGI
jgi:hypothetical protein